MPETISDDDMIQMLSDMGFDQKTTDRFMKLKDSGNIRGQIKLLNDRRSVILDNVHREENQIYRIDYLIHWIDNYIANSNFE